MSLFYQLPTLEVDNGGMVDDENMDGNLENIYGNPEEDLDFQVVQNPYYGGEVEINQNEVSIQMQDLSINNTEVITSIQNDYYAM